MRTLPLLLVLLLAAGCAACSGKHTLRLADGPRDYWVHEPAGWDGETPIPVVVGLHGGGGNAQQYRDSNEWVAASDEHGFLAVFPEGTGPRVLGRKLATWNGGICCGSALEEEVDDVAFLDAVLDDLDERYAVDTRRVYMTGHSNGSIMTFRYACERSERVAAIAPYAAQGMECTPDRTVPTLYVHGDQDRCALYEGGDCGGCFVEASNDLLGTNAEPQQWQCPSAPAYARAWAERDGCTGEPETTTEDDVTCETWSGCDVRFCTLEGGGHAYPGVPITSCENDPEGRTCEVMQEYVGPSHAFPFNDRAWAFFEQHQLPE